MNALGWLAVYLSESEGVVMSEMVNTVEWSLWECDKLISSAETVNS